ncbi:hypothetical protein PENTCL1PPCAC_1311, partial [Pristionchus entomophagus]
LLSIAAFSYSAPISSPNHDLTAKQFWSDLFTKFKTATDEEVLTIVIKKLNHFFPDFLSIDEAKEMYTVLKDYQDKEYLTGEMPKFTPKAMKTLLRIKSDLMDRYNELDEEAQKFLAKVGLDVMAAAEKLADVKMDKFRGAAEKFDQLKTRVDALSEESREGLIKEFPVFGKLEEIRAHVDIRGPHEGVREPSRIR